MNLRLAPYPQYQIATLDWIDSVPAHWVTRRLRDTVRDCINGTWGADPNGVDDLACVRVADFDRHTLRVRFARPTLRAVDTNERRRRLLRNGDLLLEKSGGGDLQQVGAVVLFDHDGEAVTSNFVARMPVASGFDSRFLTYLHSHLYAIGINRRSIKQTTGIQNLDSAAYLTEAVPLPPEHEQRTAAAFLDHFDHRINRLIRAKRRLIELLNEQKQAIINRAVTRGLDPNVRLKPSGIDWIGDVPEHWEVRSLASITDVVDPNPSHRNPVYVDEGFPFISTVEFTGTDDIILDTPRRVAETTVIEQERRCQYREGSIAFSRKGTIGATRILPAGIRFALLDSVCVVNNHPNIHYPFLYRQLTSQACRTQLDAATRGAALRQVSVGRVRRLLMLVPPSDEQANIASYVQHEVTTVDEASRRAASEIDLLREYRTRLIADVVTGKLDVRGVELPPLDDDGALDDIDAGDDEADDMIEDGANADD